MSFSFFYHTSRSRAITVMQGPDPKALNQTLATGYVQTSRDPKHIMLHAVT